MDIPAIRVIVTGAVRQDYCADRGDGAQGVQGSGAFFNFGTAFAAAQLLQPGVYIAMDGRVLHWDSVRKNKEKGVFETP
jgi:hypothetical protein